MTEFQILITIIVVLIILVFWGEWLSRPANGGRRATRCEIKAAAIEMAPFWIAMNDKDRELWKGGCPRGCINSYLSAFRDFTAIEWFYLSRMVIPIADHHSGGEGLRQIPWILAMMKDDSHVPMPHTMGPVIILTKNFFALSDTHKKAEILLHEKIHVYQRYYPHLCAPLFSDMGFTPVEEELPAEIMTRRRSNPDVQRYYRWKDGKLLIKLYRDGAQRITDAQTVLIDLERGGVEEIDHEGMRLPEWICDDENPNEIMAALLARKLISK